MEVEKKIPHYRVNYEGWSKDETDDVITYKLTYEGTVQVKTDATYQIKNIFYEKIVEPKKTVKEVLMSVGLLMLEIVFVGVLFIVF